MELHTEFWDESRFAASAEEWQRLLAHSDADPLFLSWHWMHGWWRIFRELTGELKLIAVRGGDGELLGLAPLHRHTGHYLKGWLPVERLEFIGCCSGHPAGLRSEYLDFILHRDHADRVLERLLEGIARLPGWSELRLQDVPVEAPLGRRLVTLGKIRELDRQTAYPVDTRGSFSDYLAALGRNTRLKLYNRRKLLERLGRVELRKVTASDIDRLIDALNDFDRLRFGHDSTMNDRARQQIHALQASCPGLSIAEHSSLLYLDDRLLSVIINFKLDRKIYNMQLGYQADFHKKISLGTLHLGYALEAAFADPETDCFDLLLGGGKNSDYKRHLTTESRQAASWQVLRSPLLKTLFAINDGGKRLLRRVSSS
jgi:hypothetical protein